MPQDDPEDGLERTLAETVIVGNDKLADIDIDWLTAASTIAAEPTKCLRRQRVEVLGIAAVV
jgi:hypothetical protein